MVEGSRSIQVRAPISGWHEVSRGQAEVYVRHKLSSMTGIRTDERMAYINTHLLRGITAAELIQ